jgi:aspartyl-tRNA(Asn)/glutamyl-tRNA(Gln) amidotransferase subunit B
MSASGERAAAIVEREGLAQIDDEEAIVKAVREILAAQPDVVSQYRAGKSAAFGFLMGQVMRRLGGKANPKVVNGVLRRELDAPL